MVEKVEVGIAGGKIMFVVKAGFETRPYHDMII
jgi:hypothetical protein